MSLVLLRRTDLFKTVIPSKMFESMAVARPIVLGVEGQARSILDASGGGIGIVPEDAQDLAEAILALKRDPERARRLGASGLAFVPVGYSHDALAARYLGGLNETRSVCIQAMLGYRSVGPHLDEFVVLT